MRRYGNRHRIWRSAVVIGMIASLVLAMFARPATAATTTAAAAGQYPVVVIETADASLTVGDIRRLAEQQLHRSLPVPDRVWSVDTGRVQPSRAQLDALLAGQPAPGMKVLRTTTQPSVDRTVGDLCAGMPDGTYSIWGWIIFIVIIIIRVILDK
jgi:hypothetical protein